MRVTSYAEAPYRELHVSQCEISTVWLPWRDGDIMLPCGKKIQFVSASSLLLMLFSI